MEIYVDELPKDCGYCVFCKQTEYYYYCDKLHTKLGYFNKEKDCPLKPLSEALMKERKKVVKEAKKLVVEATCYDTEEETRNHLYDLSASEVLELLDQIEENLSNKN